MPEVSSGGTQEVSAACHSVSSNRLRRACRDILGAALVTWTQFVVAMSGVIPAVIAMWLVDRLDARRPEPRSLRRLVVFWGMMSVIPAILIELALSKHVGALLAPLELTYQGASFKAFVV